MLTPLHTQPKPTATLINKFFELNNGHLVYRHVTNVPAWWSKKHPAGTPVTPSHHTDGYPAVGFGPVRSLRIHTAIMTLRLGRTPVGVDHIDGNITNNQLTNLREADVKTNNRNKALRSDNKSGYPGIASTRYGTFEVRIGVNGTKRNIGTFRTFQEAVAARQAAEVTHGYTGRR